VYAVYRCGFFPTSALADDNALENRIDRIFRIIELCRYGIHDISRTELNTTQLPRFNMPFELGVFFGARRYGVKSQKNKGAIVFERLRFSYQQYLSDISGIDTKAHNNDPHTLVRQIRNWLATTSRRKTVPSAPRLISDYDDFIIKLPTVAASLGYTNINEIPFNDYCQIVEEAIQSLLSAP
jgi:hypothetical protein